MNLLCMCMFVLYVCMFVYPPGFHYPLYGKTAGREESEVTPPGRGGAVSSKQSSDSSSSSARTTLQERVRIKKKKRVELKSQLVEVKFMLEVLQFYT